MRVQNLDIGIEKVNLWREQDEVHLPKGKPLSPLFLPRYQPLDEILRMPSLDDQLLDLIAPESLDPDLLEPNNYKSARVDILQFFEKRLKEDEPKSRKSTAIDEAEPDQDWFETIQIFKRLEKFDDEVTEALALLLRG